VRDTPPGWWGQPPAGDTLLKLTHEIAGVSALLDAVDAATARRGLRAAVRGSAGVGILHATLPGDAAAVGAVVADLRTASPAWSGDVVVLDGPSEVDPWGPVRGLDLMRRVKDQFDPEHRLAPGRFVGGI
jgi:glycolate oxidase FAD binding subunit